VAQQDFAAFFAATWTDLSGYARSLVGDPGTGDELAQEALTRVYTRYALLREPRGYAFRIVTNLARDRWKALERERRTWEDLPQEVVAPAHDGGILDAVQRLKSGHREVVLLHYWADLSVDEMAAVLRRPPGTLKRWLSEARLSLSQAMGGTA
jgi:RNA polymerase sigma-70 factor (ECF subfamily)